MFCKKYLKAIMDDIAPTSFMLLIFIMMAESGFVPSPCDEMTYGVPPGDVYNVNPSCINGSISWSYPNGTLKLFFAPTDVKNYKFAVCFHAYSNDSAFDVLDVTKGDKQHCQRISDTEVCTGYYIHGILIDVEPKGPQRFMDEIRYQVLTAVQKPPRRNPKRNKE